MNRLMLFKQMIPGLLPIFIFILADELWGTKIGLSVAIGFGIIELIITFVKEKKLEGFILTDILLLIFLGLISIALHNDIFFKLKPALIQLILCAILGISAYSSKNIVMIMTQRFMKNIPEEIQKKQMEMMQTPIKILFWITISHTALVIYSAFFMTKEAWAFISGVLFYIMFGIYFLFQLLYQRIQAKKQ